MNIDPSPDFPALSDETTGVWNRLADWWDDKIGDGNSTQDLLEPITEQLLELQPGDEVLDVACGAGRFARRMAASGARVLAIDHAEKFLERARRRTTEHADRIEYRRLNAADSTELASLGEARFDAAVCTMALMDMASIMPLISVLPRLLKPGGKFVFSVTHPVFNSGTARLVAEEELRDGIMEQVFGVKVTDYMTSFSFMGVGIHGQPEPQHYFHRPVSVLFNTCFERGFALDRMEEPALPKDAKPTSIRALSWSNVSNIPHVLIARMRLASA
ncbi:MAG: class I SAM-dependent methyltransferase [Dehalococcoidia bacterium]